MMTFDCLFARRTTWFVKIVFPTAGVHPYHVEGCGSVEDAMESIAALAALEEGNSHLRSSIECNFSFTYSMSPCGTKL